MKRWQLQLLIIGYGRHRVVGSDGRESERQWLAGDSHIHSHWSPDYDETKNPPSRSTAWTDVTRRRSTRKARGVRPEVDGHDRSWRPESFEVQLMHAYAELGVARAGAGSAAVLRHGAQHAGDGSPHADHPEQRRRVEDALQHRKPVRLATRHGRPIRRATARRRNEGARLST